MAKKLLEDEVFVLVHLITDTTHVTFSNTTVFAWEKNTLSNWRPLKDDPDRYGKYLCYFSKISATLCRQQHHNILKSQDLT